ncbi:MAG: hypothetical protein R2941_19050 [Desulfobacterales bacterium]
MKAVRREEALLYAGIRAGINIADLNLAVARRRLLANPDCRCLKWTLFFQGIRMQIAEHQPLAIFDMGRRFIVNRVRKYFQGSRAPGTPGNFQRSGVWKFTDIADPEAGEPSKRSWIVNTVSSRKAFLILSNRVDPGNRADREWDLHLSYQRIFTRSR